MFCQLFMLFSVLSASETSTIEPELTCYTSNGKNYRGTIAWTVSGETCQNWSAQTPHKHTRSPEKYPHAGLDGNYCRNPGSVSMPWCYTITDTRWDYCPVPRCEDAPRPETPVVSTEPPVVSTEPPVVSTEPTVVSTEPSVVSTEPPVVSTEPPVVSTEPPVVSTEPPVVSTEPTVVSTEPSVVSTEPPVVSTEPPVVSTEPTVVSTEPSVVSTESKQVFKVKVTLDDPTVDLNDPAVMEAILKQMKEKLKQQGVSGDVKLTWKKQPGGKVFKKGEKQDEDRCLKVNEEL